MHYIQFTISFFQFWNIYYHKCNPVTLPKASCLLNGYGDGDNMTGEKHQYSHDIVYYLVKVKVSWK